MLNEYEDIVKFLYMCMKVTQINTLSSAFIQPK